VTRAEQLPLDGASNNASGGDELGRCVILDRVGAGKVGVVFAAWTP